MRTARIQVDDVVEVRVKGRSIVGRVTDVSDGVVYFNPICPGAGWRHANAREIVTHWRNTGRRGGGDRTRARTSSRAQRAGRSGWRTRPSERC